MGAKSQSPPARQGSSNSQRTERKVSPPSEASSPPQIGETAEMRERRRKQNRLAQQAFRARQKVRVDALEMEWAQLRTLHESLRNACHDRAKEIEQLQARVESLLQEVEYVKTSQEVDRQWPASPSVSCSTASWNSSPRYQYSHANVTAPAGVDVRQYFHDGRQFPAFPLDTQYYQSY